MDSPFNYVRVQIYEYFIVLYVPGLWLKIKLHIRGRATEKRVFLFSNIFT